MADSIAGGVAERTDDSDAIFAGDAMDASRAVSAAVDVQVVEGEVRFLPQHEQYRYRGPRLAHLTLYEYVMTVRVIKRPSRAGGRRGAGEGQQRRPSNSRIEFEDGCPFKDTHVQMMRSKFVVPILAGPSPPRHPLLPEDGEVISPGKALELQRCAAFYLGVHTPWVRDGPALPLTWQSFVAWYTYDGDALPPASPGWDRAAVAGCAWMSHNSYPARCAREVTASMMAGLRRNTVAARVMGDYRFRTATRWTATERAEAAAANSLGQDGVDSGEGLFDLVDDDGDMRLQVARELLNRARAAALATSSNNPDGVYVDPTAARHFRDDVVVNSLMEVMRLAPTAPPQVDGPPAPLAPRVGGPLGHVVGDVDVFHPLVGTAVNVGAYDPALGDVEEDPGGDVADVEARADPGGGPGQGVSSSSDRPASPQAAGLDADQFAVCNKVWDWQDRGRVEPLMIQVVGAGGTGKTTLLGLMRRHLPDGFMTVAAFTGVAATLVGFGARTLNSLMRFGVPKGKSRAFLNKPISAKQRAALQAIFSKSHLLVVDEVSMLSPDMLSAIDKRLRAALDRDRPFGGVGILLCGDYLQIPPVGATTLPAVMTSTNPRSEHVSARALFADFVTYHLHTQHRFSADPAWGADMSALRAMVRNPVSPALLSSLQVLTAETFREDPVFADPAQTRILVLNNYMRCRINLERAKDFATATGRVVLGWRRPFTKAVRTALREPGPRAAAGSGSRPQPRDMESTLSGLCDDTASYFVAGAPCMVLDNVGTARGIANGTTGTYHSLRVHPEDEGDLRAQLEAGPAPGSIIWLSHPPECLNVHLHPDPLDGSAPSEALLAARQALRPFSLFQESADDPIVVPLPAVSNTSVDAVETRNAALKNKLTVKSPGVDLMFACTLWKVQGLTLARVIIEVTKGSGWSLPLLYTALSRVRQRAHVRVTTNDLDSFLKLGHAAEVVEYLVGLGTDQGGTFSSDRVADFRRAGGLPRATAGAPPAVLTLRRDTGAALLARGSRGGRRGRAVPPGPVPPGPVPPGPVPPGPVPGGGVASASGGVPGATSSRGRGAGPGRGGSLRGATSTGRGRPRGGAA
ncbi:MAG: AAA family ATPase, partial [Limnohabitans sp.]